MAFDASELTASGGKVLASPRDLEKRKEPVPQDEKDFVCKLNARRQAAIQSMGNYPSLIKKFRKYTRGKQEDDKAGGLVRANLIQAHIRRSTNRVYARNPQFSIRPTEQISPQNYQKWRNFGKTAEIVLNHHFKDAGLKRVGKQVVRAAKTVRVGWAKVYYKTLYEVDPIYGQKWNDTEEKLQHLRHLQEQIQDEVALSENRAAVKELEIFQKGLDELKEVIVSEGLCVDWVPSENIVLDLSTVSSLDEYSRCPMIWERVWTTIDRVKEEFSKTPVGATVFEKASQPMAFGKEVKGSHIVCVWYGWDRQNGMVYTIAEGMQEFLRDPITPEVVGEQWYPYFPLSLNPVDGDYWALSDVELLLDLQDEHNTARTNFREVRERYRPQIVGRKSSFTDETEIRSLQTDAGAYDVTLITIPPDQPILDAVNFLQPPQLDTRMYDTQHISQDMNMVVEGAEGPVNQPTSNSSKTLGEAELLNQSLGQQSSADTDEVEDWFERIAKYALEVLIQVMQPEQVYEIAGPPMEMDEQTGKILDGAVWPSWSMNGLFNMVQIDIKAGSSGRPNKEQEAQLWAKLMPQIMEMVKTISDLEQAGQIPLATAMRKLVEESFRRFDERLDFEEFLPEADETAEPPAPPPDPKVLELQQKGDLEAQRIEMELEKTRLELAMEWKKFNAEMDLKADQFMAELDQKKELELEKIKAMKKSQPQTQGASQ